MATPLIACADLPCLIPVIDLLGGTVVHGIAGQRDSYRPLDTSLVSGSSPPDVARALRELVGHDWLYVADLDAIQRDDPDWATLQQLSNDGGRLIVDAGLRNAARARQLQEAGAELIVAAQETLAGPQALSAIARAVGRQRTIFSLDLYRGQVINDAVAWGGSDPLTVAQRAIREEIGGMIVLDLASVGVEQGVPTREVCRQLRNAHPNLPLITGGGVRHLEDVRQLLEYDISSVLVASALHRGTIGPDEIAKLK